MAETEFSLAYDGPALADGRMAVGDLAPSLLALADVFRDASDILTEQNFPISLEIKATSEGSFDVALLLRDIPVAGEAGLLVLASSPAQALLNLSAIVMGTFQFQAWRKRRSVTTERIVGSDPPLVRVTAPEGDSIEVFPEVARLGTETRILHSTQRVVGPLRRDGVEVIEMRSSQTEVVISKSDVDAFDVDAAQPRELLPEVESDAVLQLVSPVFEGDRMWRFMMGNSPFSARVTDESFLREIEDRTRRFGSGDIIVARTRTTNWRTPDGRLHSENEIVRVKQHIEASPLAAPTLDDVSQEPPTESTGDLP